MPVTSPAAHTRSAPRTWQVAIDRQPLALLDLNAELSPGRGRRCGAVGRPRSAPGRRRSCRRRRAAAAARSRCVRRAWPHAKPQVGAHPAERVGKDVPDERRLGAEQAVDRLDQGDLGAERRVDLCRAHSRPGRRRAPRGAAAGRDGSAPRHWSRWGPRRIPRSAAVPPRCPRTPPGPRSRSGAVDLHHARPGDDAETAHDRHTGLRHLGGARSVVEMPRHLVAPATACSQVSPRRAECNNDFDGIHAK